MASAKTQELDKVPSRGEDVADLTSTSIRQRIKSGVSAALKVGNWSSRRATVNHAVPTASPEAAVPAIPPTEIHHSVVNIWATPCVDRVLCDLDAQNVELTRIIEHIKTQFPQLKHLTITIDMVDRRLRMLDCKLECDYFDNGPQTLQNCDGCSKKSTVGNIEGLCACKSQQSKTDVSMPTIHDNNTVKKFTLDVTPELPPIQLDSDTNDPIVSGEWDPAVGRLSRRQNTSSNNASTAASEGPLSQRYDHLFDTDQPAQVGMPCLKETNNHSNIPRLASLTTSGGRKTTSEKPMPPVPATRVARHGRAIHSKQPAMTSQSRLQTAQNEGRATQLPPNSAGATSAAVQKIAPKVRGQPLRTSLEEKSEPQRCVGKGTGIDFAPVNPLTIFAAPIKENSKTNHISPSKLPLPATPVSVSHNFSRSVDKVTPATKKCIERSSKCRSLPNEKVSDLKLL